MAAPRRANPRRPALRFAPVTPARWGDFARLFGPRGACAGCWCMWWRLTRSKFGAMRGAGTRRALKRLVDAGRVPGILAYVGKEPVGWCSVAPREEFSALERSRVLKPVDDRPVWSAVCFFVARPYRRAGVTSALLEGAARFAARRGAKILEGYPIEPKSASFPDVYAFTGLASAFRRAGFEEVARRSPTRPIMRRALSRR